ncbi:pyruvate kinase [Lunatibacter salilacus]|uniref:pyruvate kinase n=1 Tax=Lunatibacter salilacus TaxID=2483804 RepID=UPI00131BC434|nr:pyruvate kinase [Lunatibacter salilacus]
MELDDIRKELESMESKLVTAAENLNYILAEVRPTHQTSATNLIKYLAFRKNDRRELQLALHTHGLSALSNAESHIHRQIQAVRERLGHNYSEKEISDCNLLNSKAILDKNSRNLFSQKDLPQMPYLMVTLDSEIAADTEKMKNFLRAGMNVARINCAHEEEKSWSKIIETIKVAEIATGLACKIYMDMAGPKIRTQFLGRQMGKKKISIAENDLFYLAATRENFNSNETVVSPNELAILPYLKVGERVFVDDGNLYGIIETSEPRGIGVRVRKIFSKKKRIKTDKGINFPDSKIKISSLTEYDLLALPFILEHADMIGYSFVNKPKDIQQLRDEMAKITSKPLPIILKIETLLSFQNLPGLLLEGMKDPQVGVMIARGDLAVEMGFEKMAEIQEEILSICEAAHTPVIWATQVLENLHKSGIATRSEITDAGQAALAECIMINKGPNTAEVLRILKEIIQRAATQRIKKRFVFHELQIASRFFSKLVN